MRTGLPHRVHAIKSLSSHLEPQLRHVYPSDAWTKVSSSQLEQSVAPSGLFSSPADFDLPPGFGPIQDLVFSSF